MRHIVNNFLPQGGHHCITNSLKQIFAFYDYPLSEEMIFGIASGLNFLYLNQSSSPMVNGRTKVFEFEKKLEKRLNISIPCKSGTDYAKVEKTTQQMIDHNQPVLMYVDMPYLRYLRMNPNSHFGGHSIVAFGYDSEEQIYLVSDRDQHDFPIRTPRGPLAEDYHTISFAELEKARTSSHRPFPAKNKYLQFDIQNCHPVTKDVLKDSIEETCNNMLFPGAKLLGTNGILKFSGEILKWNHFDDGKLKLACITNYFQISKDGGTGGGIFRKMYGDFLIEASDILGNKKAAAIGRQFISISKQWDELADMLWELSLSANRSALTSMSELIYSLYEKELRLFQSLKETIYPI